MAMVFCKGCGKEIHESAPTCPHCGAVQFQKNSNTSSGDDKGFFNYALMPLKRYAEFSGRSRRKEYWLFGLFYFMVLFVAGLLTLAAENVGNMVTGVIYLGFILPSIAAGVRRMHDTNRSGWWLVVPIANLVFACLPGHQGENRFGPDPKA